MCVCVCVCSCCDIFMFCVLMMMMMVVMLCEMVVWMRMMMVGCDGGDVCESDERRKRWMCLCDWWW